MQHSTPLLTAYHRSGLEEVVCVPSSSRYCVLRIFQGARRDEQPPEDSPLCDATVAVREDLCLADLAEGNDEKQLTRVRLESPPIQDLSSFTCTMKMEFGRNQGGPRRLKINLSLVTGHATCV